MPNDFLEKTLEDLIFENRAKIHENGLPKFKHRSYRQFYLPSGRKIDIISFEFISGTLFVNLYELKKECIDTSSICQAYNYMHEFKGLLKGLYNECHVKIVLVGKKYDPISILDGLQADIEVYTYDYRLNGLQFYKQDTLIKEIAPNNLFANAIYAWSVWLTYPNGIPRSIQLIKEYLEYLKTEPEFDTKMEQERRSWIKEIKLLPAPGTSFSSINLNNSPLPDLQWSVKWKQEIDPECRYELYDDLDPTIYETDE